MLTALITAIFIVVVLYRHFRGKPVTAFLLGWMTVSPYMRIGGFSFDSSYIVVAVMFVILIFKSSRIPLPPKLCVRYFKMLLAVNVVYIISWFLFSRIEVGTMISTFAGCLKIILLLVECWALDRDINGIDIGNEIKKMVFALVVVCAIAVIYEMVDLTGSVNFLKQILNDNQISYLENQTKWGYYERYYGVFDYPMKLGMFALFSIAFIVLKEDIELRYKLLFGIVTLFIGLCAASKSFMVGLLAFLILYILYAFVGRHKTKSRLVGGSVALLILLMGLLLFNNISEFISNAMGSNIAVYFEKLANLDTILDSRFSEDNGLLANSTLYEVIEDHLLLGVGASSIRDEPVMDNAVLVILHDGGLLALLLCLVFYIELFVRFRKDPGKLIMLILILITGMGFQTWVAAPIATWILYWFTTEKECIKGIAINNTNKPISIHLEA